MANKLRLFITLSLCIGAAIAAAVALVLTQGSSPASSTTRVRLVKEQSTDRDQARRSELEGERPDFDRPFRDGVSVASVAAARSRVTFPIVAPNEFGVPVSIFVHAGREGLRQAVALVYDFPTYGRFIVVEERGALTEAGLGGIVDRCHAADVCEGTWEITSIGTGIHALRVAGSVSSVLLWVYRGVTYDIYGPVQTFSAAAATEVGEAIFRGI